MAVRMSMDRTFRVLNRMIDDGVISRYAVASAGGALAYLEPITTRDGTTYGMLGSLLPEV
jgi:hypothetical protein